jgi:hypothetical protein
LSGRYLAFMSEGSKIGDGGKAVQKARQGRRLAAALRENLKRRKAQAKGRSVAPTAIEATVERSAEPHDSAGIADDKQNQ